MAGTTALTLDVIDATVPGNMDTVNLSSFGEVSTTLTAQGVETFTLNIAEDDIDSGAFTLGSMTNIAAMTSFTVKGAGSLDLTTGALAVASNSKIDASQLTGSSIDSVTINASASTDNGLTIIGSATLNNELIAATGLAAGKTVKLVGGAGDDMLIADNANGNNVIIEAGEGNNMISAEGAAGTGTVKITAGNGNNQIYTADVGASVDTITVGNGFNSIQTGKGNDVITAGTGNNFIIAGTDADKITLGNNLDEGCAIISGVTQNQGDSVAATAVHIAAVNNKIAAGDTITFGNGVDLVYGFNYKSDRLDLEADTIATSLIGAVSTDLDGSGNDATSEANYFLSGNYNATTGVFTITADGSGADTVLFTTTEAVTGTPGANAANDALSTIDSAIILVGVDSDNLTLVNYTAF